MVSHFSANLDTVFPLDCPPRSGILPSCSDFPNFYPVSEGSKFGCGILFILSFERRGAELGFLSPLLLSAFSLSTGYFFAHPSGAQPVSYFLFLSFFFYEMGYVFLLGVCSAVSPARIYSGSFTGNDFSSFSPDNYHRIFFQ